MKGARVLGILLVLAMACLGYAHAATVAISNPAVTYVAAGASYSFNASGNAPAYYAIQAGETPVFLSYAAPESGVQPMGFTLYVDDAGTSAYDDYTGEVMALISQPNGLAGKSVSWSLQAGKQYILKVDAGSQAQVTVSTVSSVPLPGAMWLFGSALLGFLRFSSRRRV